ncbi:Outer membrane lipoprotein Omp16 [Fundidesulfovibrio magnetotacticus]|uniref:Peptidoglycan-associated lipoprotein n=1 Tax=Fundidesulfovibrio magnetotacticus TaxID=2730080 RepID=A0A6V8LQ00_9BACT|nr:peptidoglycan-associated lipoprotein Pal [Fundidesulfovibrio magnetotacticus]GFK92428.1 Outer membrane lipoprotein Omp16 [Fundidesulfovibrio magnetotacticus]
MKNRLLLAVMAILCMSLLSFGCAKKQVAGPDKDNWEEQERERLARERELREKLGRVAGELGTMIHFDFDRYDLKPEARQTLTRKAEILKQYPEIKLVIEGHCDQRGTAEYNLALGERRARAAADYLVNLGVPTAKLSIVSYGKERPLDPANNEAAWAKNRRDEFKPSY